MSSSAPSNGIVAIGRRALHASRRALGERLGEQAPDCLQEIGYAGGAELYERFGTWLPEYAGVVDSADLDAERLNEVLSAYFDELGWGTLHTERCGDRGLALTSSNWAESEPGADEVFPSCFITAGLLAEFLTRFADGEPVAVLEVECRSQGDARCQFYAGSPATLEAAYQAISEGRDYLPAFGV